MALRDLLSGYGASVFDCPKEMLGAYKGKNLAICGDAACVWDDLEKLGCRSDQGKGKVASDKFDFMTINKLVEVFPGNIEHAYSNEPGLLNKFIAARRSEYTREFRGPVHTHSCSDGTRWRWPWGGHGTSGLGGTVVGLALGYEQVVLCGMPLDDTGHNGEPSWRRTTFATSEAAGPAGKGFAGKDMYWKRAIENGFDGRVFSMSGRTKLWLGEPPLLKAA